MKRGGRTDRVVFMWHVGHVWSSPLRQERREGAGGGSARHSRVDERRATHHVVHVETLHHGYVLVLSHQTLLQPNTKNLTKDLTYLIDI